MNIKDIILNEAPDGFGFPTIDEVDSDINNTRPSSISFSDIIGTKESDLIINGDDSRDVFIKKTHAHYQRDDRYYGKKTIYKDYNSVFIQLDAAGFKVVDKDGYMCLCKNATTKSGTERSVIVLFPGYYDGKLIKHYCVCDDDDNFKSFKYTDLDIAKNVVNYANLLFEKAMYSYGQSDSPSEQGIQYNVKCVIDTTGTNKKLTELFVKAMVAEDSLGSVFYSVVKRTKKMDSYVRSFMKTAAYETVGDNIYLYFKTPEEVQLGYIQNVLRAFLTGMLDSFYFTDNDGHRNNPRVHTILKFPNPYLTGSDKEIYFNDTTRIEVIPKELYDEVEIVTTIGDIAKSADAIYNCISNTKKTYKDDLKSIK